MMVGKNWSRYGWCAVFLCLTASLAWGQAQPYPGPELQATYKRLLAEINKIKIFDHHAHPGFPDDKDVDAMAAPPGSSPLRERDDNPELAAAAKALFGYPYNDMSEEHAKWLVNKKAELKKAEGREYFSHVLDKLGIERSVANRAFMADYLDPKRFAWVFFADSFMWPFDNSKMTHRNVDQEVYIPLQESMLKRYLEQESIAGLPARFADYLLFVTRVLEDNQKKGGIAMKFEVAYFRSTKFSDPTREQAEAIYNKYQAGGVPTMEEYTTFQDYMFRHLVVEGGRLHLPVHIHSAVGIGDFFSLSESGIMNLEPILRDPRYDNTNFVMIHGGYPYEKETIWLAARKNVVLDSSLIEVILYPAEFKKVLKEWLEVFPEKITFGTDCFPYNAALGSEESYWLGVHSGRVALAAALAEMVSEGEITETRALEMAHGYLHDNALKLYEKGH